jgi:hypothetical protein
MRIKIEILSLFATVLFLFMIFQSGCTFSDPPLFESLNSEKTGISFQNSVDETDDQNMLTFEYIYNGAGVAAADFNNDGLTDLFFAGNEVSNALYINRGNFQFDDVSLISAIKGDSTKWYSGVSAVDINSDGLMDIYLSVTGRDRSELRKNELYINRGVNNHGIPVFEEKARLYGLDDSSFSTHAAFFDYNNDGILDIYLLVANSGTGTSYANAFQQMGQINEDNKDKLFKGSWDDELGHPVYTDVSDIAGIDREGYGLGVNILDINMDGFKDLYITNDYASEDLFWINNGDGTFTNRISEMLNHTSYSAMGSDVADINNDGRLDLFALDMLPNVNVRAKMMANPNNYRNYVNDVFANAFPQFTKNTLQLNMGRVSGDQLPKFSEIAALANIEATDWSWSALLADFNNSGYRDLFITNGIPRDITDKDFWSEYGRVRDIMPMSMALPKIPEVPASNFIFENNKNLTFSDRSNSWGFENPGYSTGSVYTDLDNDGDLDLVVNNINSEAVVYRNNTVELASPQQTNWLKINVTGTEKNNAGLGAVMNLFFSDGTHQKHEHSVCRGYLSSVDPTLHFGLGEEDTLDSLKISYYLGNQKYEKTYHSVEANQLLEIDLAEFEAAYESNTLFQKKPTYTWVSEQFLPNGAFSPLDYNDFSSNPTLLYKISELGPASASGDISGNGLDDLFVGPIGNQPGFLLLQQESGMFIRESFDSDWKTDVNGITARDAVLTDVNADGFLDLYVAVATLEADVDENHAADRLYINDGTGRFELAQEILPGITTNSNVVLTEDLNGDGLMDLFIGSGADNGTYPISDRHYLLLNDLKNSGTFVDQTEEVSPDLFNYRGIINDAVMADFFGDENLELAIAGDWEPIRVFQKEEGKFEDKTTELGIDNTSGLWMSVSAADVNSDGRSEIIAGNFGKNALFDATHDQPMRIYYGDLTGDGFFESVPSRFTIGEGGRSIEFPYHYREDFMRHIPGLMGTYPTHESYGRATMQEITDNFQGEIAMKEVNSLESLVYNFEDVTSISSMELPSEAQFSPVFDALLDDADSLNHIFLIGNIRGGDVYSGSYDALESFIFEVNNENTKEPHSLSLDESGIHLNGYARSVYKIKNSRGKSRYAIIYDTGEVRLFEKR